MRATHSRTKSTHPRGGATAPRDGVALIIALMATVLIGALVAGAVYASTQEYRIGRYATSEPRAMTVAETGLNVAAAQLRNQSLALPADGASSVIPIQNMPQANGDRADVVLTRLTDTTYMLTSTGTAGSTTAGAATDARTVRRTRLLLRHVRPQFNFLAALTTNGPTKIGGSSELSGNDVAPAGWSGCPTAKPAKPAIVTNKLSNVEVSGNKVSVTGASPAIQADLAAGDTNTYFKYGDDTDWKTMAAMADFRLPDGWNGKPAPIPLLFTATSKCTYNDAAHLNWGEPFVSALVHPCASYFPLIYAEGDLHLTGGRGQGILMVNGELEVAGGFEFYGPVIVRGRVKTTGTGGHFNGGVMAANVELDQNVVLGDAVISYSSCAIEKAVSAAGTMRGVRNRSWAMLY
jgi:hypothetical protein